MAAGSKQAALGLSPPAAAYRASAGTGRAAAQGLKRPAQPAESSAALELGAAGSVTGPGAAGGAGTAGAAAGSAGAEVSNDGRPRKTRKGARDQPRAPVSHEEFRAHWADKTVPGLKSIIAQMPCTSTTSQIKLAVRSLKGLLDDAHQRCLALPQ